MNNNLVTINSENTVTTTSLMIAETFGKEHKRVLQDIRELEVDGDFNRHNFVLVEYPDKKGEKRPMYEITRDGFIFLVMGYTGKEASRIKLAYINAFNEMEKHLLNKSAVPQSLPEALRLAADLAEKNQALEQKVKEDEPKVLLADAIGLTNDLITVAQLSNILNQNGINTGEKRLYGWLRDNDFIYKDSTQPKQKALDMGLFRVTEHVYFNSKQEPKTAFTTKVTGKGQQYFVNKFLSDKNKSFQNIMKTDKNAK